MDKIRPILFQILSLLVFSAILAGAGNLLLPKRIPWIQDWGSHIETLAQQENIQTIPLRKAWELHGEEQCLFVDARVNKEYQANHIRGALSCPLEQLNDNPETLEALLLDERSLVIYCSNNLCDDGLLLAIELKDMGQTNCVLLVDGFTAWKEATLPVEPNANIEEVQ